MSYAYRILNVFALRGDRFSGNPLCVFEDARGLTDDQMQALALQLNLSETTFLFPSERAHAHVRIFTPSYEMPFAGHPTLGTAFVVRSLSNTGDTLTLEMKAGVIPVTAREDFFTLRANPPRARAVEASRADLAEMLGIDASDMADEPSWIDTGSEQLVIPLTSVSAVDRAAPSLALLERYGRVSESRQLAYVFAPKSEHEIVARFFFRKGTGLAEDPATGSACANLGGYYVTRNASLPLERTISQGAKVKRPSELHLRVDAEKNIFVSGLVIEIGRGTMRLS